ncbi:hypothetical protein ABKA04_002822 [Annulohypoxylon sp. FPYF3050]
MSSQFPDNPEDYKTARGTEFYLTIHEALPNFNLSLPCPVNDVFHSIDYLTQNDYRGTQSLREALSYLTHTQFMNIRRQVFQYLRSMGHMTASRMETFDGRPIYNPQLFKPLPDFRRMYSSCATDSELRLNLSLAIEDELGLVDRSRFMNKMPSGVPFTFSHGEISVDNVRIKDGEFVGLDKWELCGFYPIWWEYIGCDRILEVPYVHQPAMEWFSIYCAIRDRPDTPETTAMLNKYLQGDGR